MSPLADVIATLHELPSPRGVALGLMHLAQREDASVADVVRIVRTDPALTGRLIHAANRVNTVWASPTGLLEEAVLRLGFCATRQIALGFSLVNDYRTGRCAAFDYPGFWTGSLLRGVAAQVVAATAGEINPQQAFVSGLLADVGRLALATAHPQAYADLLAREACRGARLRREERKRFSIDHAELGVALLERWAFPEDLVRTVREFQGIAGEAAGYRAADSRLTLVTGLADAVAQASVPGAPPAWKQVVLDAAARMALGTDALQALAAELAHEVSAWAPLFELAVPAPSAIDIQEYEHPGPVASGQDRAASIVLVDDSEDDRLIACRILERAGHRVHAVPSGEEALRAITSVLPHIVITDWEMPGMDGTGLCRALRATRMGQDLYLILYTGRCRGRDLVAGIDAGADDFVSKSAGHDVLLARVRAGARASRRTGARAVQFRDTRLRAVELAASTASPGVATHG